MFCFKFMSVWLFNASTRTNSVTNHHVKSVTGILLESLINLYRSSASTFLYSQWIFKYQPELIKAYKYSALGHPITFLYSKLYMYFKINFWKKKKYKLTYEIFNTNRFLNTSNIQFQNYNSFYQLAFELRLKKITNIAPFFFAMIVF